MAVISVKVGGAALPGNLVELKRSDELLWSEGTGRSASTGAMAGSVVAQKQTYTLTWGPITAAQYKSIRSACGPGFESLSIEVNGAELADCTVYRGNISGTLMGVHGGTAWYRDVSVELVER